MADPFTLAAVGAVVLSKGVDFLFAQTGELLKWWRERKDAQSNPASATQRIEVTLPPAMGGGQLNAEVEFAAVDEASKELSALRAELLKYTDGTLKTTPDDVELLTATDRLRGLLEEVYGQRLTLDGEDRPPSGSPVVSAVVKVGELRGKATAADVDEMTEGKLSAVAEARVVNKKAKLTAVRLRHLGRRPGERPGS